MAEYCCCYTSRGVGVPPVATIMAAGVVRLSSNTVDTGFVASYRWRAVSDFTTVFGVHDNHRMAKMDLYLANLTAPNTKLRRVELTGREGIGNVGRGAQE